MVYLYELDVQSSDVQEWVFCAFVQNCPLQHPVGVAMVTYCTKAFAQRHRHFHFRFRKCMIVLQSLSHQNMLRNSDLLVSVPFGLEFSKEQHISEQKGRGVKIHGRQTEGYLFLKLTFVVLSATTQDS